MYTHSLITLIPPEPTMPHCKVSCGFPGSLCLKAHPMKSCHSLMYYTPCSLMIACMWPGRYPIDVSPEWDKLSPSLPASRLSPAKQLSWKSTCSWRHTRHWCVGWLTAGEPVVAKRIVCCHWYPHASEVPWGQLQHNTQWEKICVFKNRMKWSRYVRLWANICLCFVTDGC